MKKSLVLTLGLFITLIGIMSCGGGADEEARAQAIRDSLRNDSILKVAALQAYQDSVRQDSILKAEQARAEELAAALEAANQKPGTKPKASKPPVTTPDPVPPVTTPPTKPLTGKDAIKGGTDAVQSGKDAIKNAGGTDGKTTPSGKDAIKGKK
jgi:hypothetical protein